MKLKKFKKDLQVTGLSFDHETIAFHAQLDQLSMRLKELKFAWEQLQDAVVITVCDEIQHTIESLYKTIGKRINKLDKQLAPFLKQQMGVVQHLMDTLRVLEAKLLGLFTTVSVKKANVSDFVINSLNHFDYKQHKANVDHMWETWGVLANKQLKALHANLLELHTNVPSKLAHIVSHLQQCNKHVLAENVKQVALQLSHMKLGKYLDNIAKIDTTSCKLIITSVCPEQPLLHALSDDQDLKQPLLYGAKLANDVLEDKLAKFCVVDKQGRFSYKIFSFEGTIVLLLDGWFIAREPEILHKLDDGDVFQMKKASKLVLRFNKQASPKQGAVVRCTFTSNARFDDAFMDYMRDQKAMKIGPNTWDIPVSNNHEIDQLKAKLKLDWGYPFIYENVETPSLMYQLYDTGPGGVTHWASVVRLAKLETDAYVKKEDGKFCVRSKHNESWNGGCYDTKEEAESRLKQVEYFKHKKASPNFNKPVLAAKLRIASEKSFAHKTKLTNLANNLCVVSNLLVASHNDDGLLHPEVHSTICINKRSFFVKAVAKDALAWLHVEDDHSKPFVVTKPDINSNVALLEPSQFDTVKNRMSPGKVTTLKVHKDSLHNVPTSMVVKNDQGEQFLVDEEDLRAIDFHDDEGPSYCHVTVADSPMGGKENHMFMHQPSGMPSFDYQTGEGLLYYPTPPKLLVPVDIKHYREVPTDMSQEPNTNEMLPMGKKHVTLTQQHGTGGYTSVDFAEHPNTSQQGTDQTPGPERLDYTTSPFQMQKLVR